MTRFTVLWIGLTAAIGLSFAVARYVGPADAVASSREGARLPHVVVHLTMIGLPAPDNAVVLFDGTDLIDCSPLGLERHDLHQKAGARQALDVGNDLRVSERLRHSGVGDEDRPQALSRGYVHIIISWISSHYN